MNVTYAALYKRNGLGLEIIQVKVGPAINKVVLWYRHNISISYEPVQLQGPLFPGLRVMFEFLEVEREMTSALL